MKLQVLVSTMHQTDHSILQRMNIQTEAIMINQCDRNEFEELVHNGKRVRVLSLAERGVGLSRNCALQRATAEICLFADDDVSYVDGYEDIVLAAFQENPQADLIVFNVPSTNPARREYTIPRNTRLRWYNSMRYGTFRIALRTESIRKANIHFSLLFGAGARYWGGGGEDSLFILDCFKMNLAVYASPQVIGSVSHHESTWYQGPTDKYLLDKGAL
jgi:glycosyltransferase involved in cell wall biosynthesis